MNFGPEFTTLSAIAGSKKGSSANATFISKKQWTLIIVVSVVVVGAILLSFRCLDL